MKNKEIIEGLLKLDLERDVVIAHNSLRLEIRKSDIKEEDGKIIIQY